MKGEIDFFISRAGDAAEQADLIAKVLRDAGCTVLLQGDNFGNASFMAMMAKGWSRANKMICILSKDYQKSEHCKKEYEVALTHDPRNLQERVIVFRVARVAPIEHLTDLGYTDLVSVSDNPELQGQIVRGALGIAAGGDDRSIAKKYWRAPTVAADASHNPEFRGVLAAAFASVLLGVVAEWQSQQFIGLNVSAKPLAISSAWELMHISLALVLQGMAAYFLFGWRRLQGGPFAARFAHAALSLMPAHLVLKLIAVLADVWFVRSGWQTFAGVACASDARSVACLQEAQALNPSFTGLQLGLLVAGTLWINARLASNLRNWLAVSWPALLACNVCVSLCYVAALQFMAR
jgi:hypothetical protein